MTYLLEIRPIKTEEDYKWALASIDKLWDSSVGTREGDTLDVLTTLVEKFEEDNYPVGAPGQ